MMCISYVHFFPANVAMRFLNLHPLPGGDSGCYKGTIRDIISLVVNHPVLRVVVMLNVCSFMLL